MSMVYWFLAAGIVAVIVCGAGALLLSKLKDTPGPSPRWLPCPACNGTGRIHSGACVACNGAGQMEREMALAVAEHLRAGPPPGTDLRTFASRGTAAPDDDPSRRS